MSNNFEKSEKSALEQFGYNLTEAAKSGKLDPVIGRDSEIRRISQVLSRRTKNNPVLIGDPGVGKTAVVEGLAQRIIAGDVAESLKNKELIVLDIASLVAGAKYRGEFEERLQAVLKEINESAGKIITFIDEMHTLMGAGGNEGSLMAANMLKPMLARGELRMIGATTLNEYREYIEKDAALERRFQQVYVGEPSVEDTIAILRGLKERYEAHHKVAISDSALISAAELSYRYIPARQLPDKAIDLIDEAASKLRMEIDSAPTEIDELKRTVERLTLEKLALNKEKDKESKLRQEKILETLQEKQKQLNLLESKWNSERNELNLLGELKEKLDSLKIEAEKAQRRGDLERASKILYGEIPIIQKQLENAEQKNQNPKKEKMVNDRVNPDDIAEVISAWTGIPLGRLLASESQRLVNLESEITKNIIGQKKAITAIANAIRRSRSGVALEDKPTGSFMFLGPTGVGKTELAKTVAEILFNDAKAMIRIDMSEYSEKHSVARLIGAPPGYIGFESGGQLTEAVRRRPYSVILFDEVEKAHPEIFDLLLQVLDDGRLSDGQGKTVDFKNTIIMLTSNLGSNYLVDSGLSPTEKEKEIMKTIRASFKPEFINRLDEIVIFDALTESDLGQIVEIAIEKLQHRLAKKKISIAITPDARSWLAHNGYDFVYGARPLKRLMQNEIDNKLANAILSDELNDNKMAIFDRNSMGTGLQLTIK